MFAGLARALTTISLHLVADVLPTLKKHVGFAQNRKLVWVFFKEEEGCAVDQTSCEIALAGEAGCGKTTTALALFGLVAGPGHLVSGAIMLREKNRALFEKQFNEIRGKEMGLIL